MELTNVGPNNYISNDYNTSFKQNHTNSTHFGTRAARHIDPRIFGFKHRKMLDQGIF